MRERTGALGLLVLACLLGAGLAHEGCAQVPKAETPPSRSPSRSRSSGRAQSPSEQTLSEPTESVGELPKPAPPALQPPRLRSEFPHGQTARKADVAIIEKVLELYMNENVTNLAAGYAFWGPPKPVLEEGAKLLASGDPELNTYGDGRGLPELREKLKLKLANENKITGREVMVTAGANQAFVNVVNALIDKGDRVAVFTPYYFSHQIALQLAGADVQVAPCDEDLEPDLSILEEIIDVSKKQGKPVKMVVLTTPSNPTGVVAPGECIELLTEICRKAGAWLVCDETYEYFTYGDAEHVSPNAQDGVINIYSFSKAYGMAGWRVGYMAYPKHLHDDLLKVQDTIITHPTVLAQKLALKALESGREWVRERIKELEKTREIIWDCVDPMCIIEPKGAFYFFVPIPSCITQDMVVGMLAERHKILVAPGTSFGMNHHIRISYGSLSPEAAVIVGKRLMEGMHEICKAGLTLTFDTLCSHPASNGRDGTWGPPLMPEDELRKRELEAQRQMSQVQDGTLHVEDQ